MGSTIIDEYDVLMALGGQVTPSLSLSLSLSHTPTSSSSKETKGVATKLASTQGTGLEALLEAVLVSGPPMTAAPGEQPGIGVDMT